MRDLVEISSRSRVKSARVALAPVASGLPPLLLVINFPTVNLSSDLVPAEYTSLLKSKTLVLTGAGTSVPFGMPAMDGFLEIIKGDEFQQLAKLIVRDGPSGKPDLEYLLGRLTYYRNILHEWQRDKVLQGWMQLSDKKLGERAGQLRDHIFEQIIRRYGRLTQDARKKAAQFLFPLLIMLRQTAGNNPLVLPIFTTNYDLTYENLSAEVSDLSICTGMVREGPDS
jgi:hypothetical protein